MTWNPSADPYHDDPRFAPQGPQGTRFVPQNPVGAQHAAMGAVQSQQAPANAAGSAVTSGADVANSGHATGAAQGVAVGGGQQATTSPDVSIPRVDVTETPDSYLVEVEMPGFEKRDISVYADENQLIVAGERTREEQEGHRVVQRECPRRLERTIQLPIVVDEDETTATYEAGVCAIEVPKGDAEERKRIGFQ
jgi:HSP20 family protein